MIFNDTSFLNRYEKNPEGLVELIQKERRVQNYLNDFHSVLMLSAHKIKHLNKIDELEADCIMLNLEDGVAKESKKFALYLSALFLSHLQKSDKKLVVRVNALDEGGLEEIQLLNQVYPDAIRVPKIRSVADVQKALNVIDEGIELHLSIETKEAWLALKELKVSERVRVFYLGILDLFADLQISQTLLCPTNKTLHYILSEFLVLSQALGVKPVSFVFQEYKDEKQFSEYLQLEKSMGYHSKACISPSQVKIVNEFYKQDMQKLLRAQEIVRSFEEKRVKGESGFKHKKYGFIDEPIYKDALNTLAKEKM